jgi:hypothetical protein
MTASFESAAKFKFVGATVANERYIRGEVSSGQICGMLANSQVMFFIAYLLVSCRALLPFGPESFVIPPAVQGCKG